MSNAILKWSIRAKGEVIFGQLKIWITRSCCCYSLNHTASNMFWIKCKRCKNELLKQSHTDKGKSSKIKFHDFFVTNLKWCESTRKNKIKIFCEKIRISNLFPHFEWIQKSAMYEKEIINDCGRASFWMNAFYGNAEFSAEYWKSGAECCWSSLSSK